MGEGTTAVFRQMLKYFGLDEFAFLKETEATIKFGIRHKDWRRVGHHYDGPIDDPHLVLEPQGGTPAKLSRHLFRGGGPPGEGHAHVRLFAGPAEGTLRAKDGWQLRGHAAPSTTPFILIRHLAGKWLRKHTKGVDSD